MLCEMAAFGVQTVTCARYPAVSLLASIVVRVAAYLLLVRIITHGAHGDGFCCPLGSRCCCVGADIPQLIS